MDPDAPQRDSINSPSTNRVQTWVMSTLAVTSIVHLSFGLLAAAWFIDEALVAQRWGLVVLSAVTGVIAVAAGLAIHRRPVGSPWLALGLLFLPLGGWVLTLS